jgi:hypothetical protein
MRTKENFIIKAIDTSSQISRLSLKCTVDQSTGKLIFKGPVET